MTPEQAVLVHRQLEMPPLYVEIKGTTRLQRMYSRWRTISAIEACKRGLKPEYQCNLLTPIRPRERGCHRYLRTIELRILLLCMAEYRLPELGPRERLMAEKTSEDKILALESQIQLLRDEKHNMKRKLMRASKTNGIYQALVDEMQAIVTPLEPLPAVVDTRTKQGTIEEHLVLHLSDEHADEIVEPHKVGGLENFNFGVALCRAETLIDSIINFTQKSLSNYRFSTLTIFWNGDHTSGTIHGGEDRSEYRNMFRNSFAIGQMGALMFRDLAPFFKRINILCLSGNHGRRTIKKDYDGAWSNWDYMIHEVAKLHCHDLKNVHFEIPDSWSANVDIEGYGFCVAHGDDVKSWNSIPFYGIERKTRRLVALHNSVGKRVDYFVFGHFHTCSSMADLRGETFINGAFPATSAYGYESFSGYREPMQLLHGVHADYGVTWRLPVKIKNPKREAAGPQRYKVILASPGMSND